MLILQESVVSLEIDALCELTILQNRCALFQDWVVFMAGEKSSVTRAGFFKM